MGLLALSLLFVGIVLFVNGMGRIKNIDPKSTAVLNLIVGFIIISGNLMAMGKAADIMAYQNIASGYLFGFTYIFIFANSMFDLDLKPFGWFSLFAAIYACVMGILALGISPSIMESDIWGGTSLVAAVADYKFAYLWFMWTILWLSGFVEIICNVKMAKIAPYIVMVEGIFAAFIPSILMFLGLWA